MQTHTTGALNGLGVCSTSRRGALARHLAVVVFTAIQIGNQCMRITMFYELSPFKGLSVLKLLYVSSVCKKNQYMRSVPS